MDKAFIKNPVEAYEKLKEEIKQLKVENEELVTKCHQLGQENETLRQFLSKEPLALQALQSAYLDYKKRSEVFYEMLKDCKQTLKEIKEIVCLELAYGTNEEYANFYMQQREAILLKISECEGDNEV